MKFLNKMINNDKNNEVHKSTQRIQKLKKNYNIIFAIVLYSLCHLRLNYQDQILAKRLQFY